MCNRIAVLAILLLCLSIAAPAAAQDRCTLQTVSGTYAFYERGSSLILDPLSQPYPVHWAAAVAPFVTVGEITLSPDGNVTGFYWIYAGSLNSGLDPTPVQGTMIEFNADCTGTFEYTVTLPGASASDTIRERLVFFDSGREFRSVPSFIDPNGITTLTWIGYGHRLWRDSGLVNTCGPSIMHGTYVSTSENIIDLSPDIPAAFSDAVITRLNVAKDGSYTGTLYEKLGEFGPIESPVSGSTTVNPDCSYAQTLYIESIQATIDVRGVVFDQGTKIYGLVFGPGILASLATGERVSP